MKAIPTFLPAENTELHVKVSTRPIINRALAVVCYSVQQGRTRLQRRILSVSCFVFFNWREGCQELLLSLLSATDAVVHGAAPAVGATACA